MYIYPEHLKARAVMWLWQLRDLTVIGVGVLFSVLAAVQTGVIIPALITAAYAFLTIRLRIPVSWILSAMPALIFQAAIF